MTDKIDSQLRDYATRWRTALPDPPDLADVPVGGRRPARHWSMMAAAATAVVVALVAVGSVALSQRWSAGPAGPAAPPPSSAPPAVVPWSAAGVHADPSTSTVPKPTAAPAGTRACTSADFALVSARSTSSSTIAGWVATSYVLQSTAASGCSVSAYGIDVELVDGTGQPLPQDVPRPAGPLRTPSNILVDPGQLVSGSVDWSRYEGRASRPAEISVLPSTHTPKLAISLTGVDIPPQSKATSNSSQWSEGWYYLNSPSVADPGTLGSLTAAINVPASVAVGAPLRYTVTLANHTAVPVSLAACPDFVEQLQVVHLKQVYPVQFRGPLNCAAAPASIAAGSSVVFAFELDTSGVGPGTGHLTWRIAGSAGFPPAEEQLTVTAGPSPARS